MIAGTLYGLLILAIQIFGLYFIIRLAVRHGINDADRDRNKL